MLTWTKDAPTVDKFTGVDANGVVTFVATLTQTGAACNLTLSSPNGGGTIGSMNIPGDFAFAKSLLGQIAAAI